MKNIIEITDDLEKQIVIGKKIFEKFPEQYSDKRMISLMDDIQRIMGDVSKEKKWDMFYNSVYNYWVYGNNLRENFFYKFFEMKHEQKKRYITFRNRFLIYNILNDKQSEIIFKKKYETYKKYEDYYGRDVIEISSEADYYKFKRFISNNQTFFVKPESLGLGIGVHRENLCNYASERELFDKLLLERYISKNESWAIGNSVVLEEEIKQVEEMAEIHPYSVNIIRISTVVQKNGDVDFVDAWFRVGINKSEIAAASNGEIYSGVNLDTGIVETNGYTEFGDVFVTHPDTKIDFVGYKIPKWNELLNIVNELALRVPEVRYVGWDMALTRNGWVIVEGNENGEFLGQLVYNKPYGDYIRKFVDIDLNKCFWWENS